MKTKEQIEQLIGWVKSVGQEDLEMDEPALSAAFEHNADQTSLTIKILSAIGGVLASLTFIGFIMLAGLYDSDMGMLITGIILLGGSIGMNKKYDTILLDTLSLSAYIIGLMLIAFGLKKFDMHENLILLLIMLISSFGLLQVKNFMHVFTSTVMINSCLLMLILVNDLQDLICIYVGGLTLLLYYWYNNEDKLITKYKKYATHYNPIRIALLVILLASSFFLGRTGDLRFTEVLIWLTPWVTIGCILHFLTQLFQLLEITQKQRRMVMYAILAVVLGLTSISPPISTSLLIVLLSFRVSHTTGVAIGIMAFIYAIGQFYYDLQFSLLTKSIMMMVSGLLFLGLYYINYHNQIDHEKL